jgi:hypothetical protein
MFASSPVRNACHLVRAIRAAFQKAGVVFDDGATGGLYQRRFRACILCVGLSFPISSL